MLLVSDANIFIDLYKINLLDKFDKLDFVLATTDFVFDELNKEQRAVLQKLNIEIVAFNGNETAIFYSEFQTLQQLHISYQDYSIFYVAKKHNGELLSNDKTLRNFASAKQIKVKGIFYVLDKMVEMDLVSKIDMAEHLALLSKINNRLPINEIEKRIESYSLAK